MQNIPSIETLNHRFAERQDCRIAAKICFNGVFLTDCLIKDLSQGGMRLFLPKAVWIPATFEIEGGIFDTPVVVSRSWQNGQNLGVRFHSQ